jgi:hypothetical protein
MINSRVSWRSFTRQRKIKVILIVILIIGLLASGLKARDRIPFYPQDLISYVGGFFAFSDGGNPYNTEFVRQSLTQRDINTSPYRFVYPPPFLMLFFPLYFLPYSLFRLIWIITALLSVWIALWLLASRLKGLYSLLFALMGALYFTVAAALHDSLIWGQITPVMLLALSIVVFRDFKGVLAGIVSSMFPLIKLGFSPLVFFLKGRRALYSLILTLLALMIMGAAVFGPLSYGNWFDSIATIGRELSTALDNNLSIARGISTFTETWVHEFDEQRAMMDDEYRLHTALRIRNTNKTIYHVTVLLLTIICAIILFTRKRSGRTLKRDSLLSTAVLYLLVVIPFLWLHYGLFLIFPLWTLLRRRNITAAILFFATVMFWGMPICMPGIIGSLDWLRFLIPLSWLVYFMLASEKTPAVITHSKEI